MSTQAAQAQKALAARDYNTAVNLYTQALKSSNSPLWLTQRSIAYLRQGSYELALQDAESAVLEAISRGRRELIASAQMRRAIALYMLQLYGDARLCFTWVRRLNEKENGLGMWQEKVRKDYDALPENSPGKKVTLKEIPDKAETAALIERTKTVLATEKLSNLTAPASPPNPQPGSSNLSMSTLAAAPLPTPKTDDSVSRISTLPAQTPKEKIRQEWYQSNVRVVITIFAKNVPADKVDIEYSKFSLAVSFPTGSAGASYEFTVMPLFGSIDVSKSSHTISPTKIEINLHKLVAGSKWPALEGVHVEGSDDQKVKDEMPSSTVLQSVENSVPSKAPTYPTSSRTGTKDWDALAKQALQKEKKSTEKGDIDASLDDDDDDEGDALNGFFKKLYKDANPDTRRAMMKSYVESNGTALSTNWDEVGKKTVETVPPEGIEAKKWES